MTTILQRLREQTQDSHKRLETRLDLLDALLSRERYLEILASFYGFYVPVEARLEQICAGTSPDLQFCQRRKALLLRQDLLNLGLSHQQIEGIPCCSQLPTLDRFSQALGCLYVLEGATLGGAILSRHLYRVHGLHAQNGTAFFSSYGPHVGAMWRAFGAVLTTDAPPQEENFVIGAACETFARLESWLCDES